MNVDELMKYAYKPPHSLFRYRHIGDLKIEGGRPDRGTFYNVSQGDMAGISKPLSNPPYIKTQRSDIKAYIDQAHLIVTLLCSHLDAQLHLGPSILTSLQPVTSHPKPHHVCYASHPPSGSAIISLGDAMVEWSSGILRSNMQRVAFAPGLQAQAPRYGLAFLVRRADVPMKRLSRGAV